MGKKRAYSNVDWGNEIVHALGIVGKVILRILSYVLNIFLTIMLICLITGTIVGGAFAIYVKNYVDPNIDDFEYLTTATNQTTKIYYMNFTDRENGIGTKAEIENQRLYGGENRMWAAYQEIPKNLVNAFVAIEDKHFFSHNGVDWPYAIKAALLYFTGNMDGGASTITQQLIKNVTQDDDVTIQRKVQEMLRALKLEKEKDKTEILELYLNYIYLSRGCYGVSAAAYTYFGKDLSELNLLECATIAAITQNPSKYDPISHPEKNIQRRQEVLNAMYAQGMITEQERAEVYYENPVLDYHSSSSSSTSNVNTWYTDAAISEAIELLMDKYGYEYGVASTMIYTGGFQIITAQDPNVQNVLETYFANDENFQSVDDSFIQPEASCIIIDPTTGDVLGLVGGRGEKLKNRILNYATQTQRPAGSSIKPLSVYAPALETGLINYATVYDDTPVNFGESIDPETGKTVYARTTGYPKNAPNVYNGLTTIHSAVRRSVNTVAYKILQDLSLETSFDFVYNKLHMTSLIYSKELAGGTIVSDLAYAPLALGQFTYGVTLKEITAAYSIFVNDGIYNKPRIVLQILDSEGKVIIDNEKESEIVISEQNASIMTKMLEEVVDSGTASKMTLKNKVDVAGKTGTTSTDYDRWFIGYTPYYLGGVWFGYSMPKSLSKFSATTSPSLVIWDDIMTLLHKDYIDEAESGGAPLKTFTTAPGVVTCTYCMDSGMLLTDACKADPRGSRAEIGYFTADNMPTEYCNRHVMVNYDTVTKSIATPSCPAENIVQVGLITVKRSFPFQIYVTDAQYVAYDMPLGTLYGTSASEPYFINLIPDGTYVGITNTSTQYNHSCAEHPYDPYAVSEPETEEPGYEDETDDADDPGGFLPGIDSGDGTFDDFSDFFGH